MPLVLFTACLAGCGGKSAADYQKDSQAALDGRDNDKAVQIVAEALGQDAVKKDAAAAWRLEQIRLDALARGGKGAQTKTELERLAGAYPKQVYAALYRSLADKARAAGDTAGAIDILTAGDQRFPDEHASFTEAIDTLKKSGELDPGDVERLKSLGYL
jgi:hypothetical protein